MATYTWMSAPSYANDVAFRKWCQGIHDSFAACGWVQTADTGQIDLTTMTTPVSSPAGFEMWRMADALQATAPVFVKIEYGKSSTSAMGFWVTVGRATDGAGVIGGTLYARMTAINSSSDQTEYPSYASGDTSSIAIVPWSGCQGQASFSLFIERSRDSAGVPTANALLVAFMGSAVNAPMHVIGYRGVPGSVMHATSQYCATLPGVINGLTGSLASTLSKDGVVAPVLPIACMAPGVTPWVSNIMIAVHPGDAGSTSVITAATINGATHTYRAWTAFNSYAGMVSIGLSKCVPAMIWE
jgi:hypothetical protein